MVCRVLTELENFALNGFRPISGNTLNPAFEEIPAMFDTTGRRGALTAMEVLKLVISTDVLNKAIIEKINRNLKNAAASCSAGESSRYVETNCEEWWRFFIKLVVTRLLKKGKGAELTDLDIKFANGLITKHRFSALKMAHTLEGPDIQELREALRLNLRTIIALGNYGVIDETLYAHTGHTMRLAGNSMNIPHKPHPYGLLAYGLVQQLLYSKAPIMIDFEPRLPEQRLSGPEAFRILTARNFSKNSPDVHIYADSLFSGPSQVAEFRRTGVKVTISFGDNATNDLVALRRHCLPDLVKGMSRTFSTPSAIVQVTDGEDKATCVLSTFWRSTGPHVAMNPATTNYKIAIALFDSDATDDELAGFLEIDPLQYPGDRIGILEHYFEVNLATPPPGPCGLHLTAKNLNEMTVPRLRILHNKTHGCAVGATAKKDALVKEILRHHPAAHLNSKVTAWLAAERTERAVHGEICGLPEKSNRATSNYQARYGLLDRMDRHLYEDFGTAYHSNWETCFVFSILFQQVINAHSLFEEHLHITPLAASKKKRTTKKKEKKDPFRWFLHKLLKEMQK